MRYRIGEEEIFEAVEGHVERFQEHGPRPIDRILIEADIDPDEVRAAVAALIRIRNVKRASVGKRGDTVFGAGVIEGFVIGARAERAAQRKDNT